jgi:peptidyl-prolyl cis-trans isomerase SurA
MRRERHRGGRLKRILALLPLLVLLGCGAAGAEVVDRSIALVNGHLVTWSDLDEEMRFEALENGRALKDLTPVDRHSAFDHLVEAWILRDQMQGVLPATDSEVAARISELRIGLKMENDEARWSATLDSYGLSSDELRRLVANQLEILKFTEFRIRPLVRVSRKEVQDYYNQKLVPQVEAMGQTAEPIAKLTPKIRELLLEQKMNQEMDKWLRTLRSQAPVQVLWDGVR